MKAKISAETLFELFIVKQDRMAFQKPDGSYAGNVKTSKNEWLKYLRQHIEGFVTTGSYALNDEDETKWLCFDIDCKDDTSIAEKICSLLSFHLKEDLNIPHSIEFSGHKGYHVWIFFETCIQSKIARQFAHWFLKKYTKLKKVNQSKYMNHYENTRVEIEIFPKQDSTEGLGSLVKVPLGKHKTSGFFSKFIEYTDQMVSIDDLMTLQSKHNKSENFSKEKSKMLSYPQSPGEWNIYRTLQELCSDNISVKVPLKRLAEKTGYTRQTASKWMHSLSSKGIINIKLEPTDTFVVYRPKYKKHTKLIKREYFITVNQIQKPKVYQTITKNCTLPSFKIRSPFRLDRKPSLVYLPKIGLWKDYATGEIYSKKDPKLKFHLPKTYYNFDSA